MQKEHLSGDGVEVCVCMCVYVYSVCVFIYLLCRGKNVEQPGVRDRRETGRCRPVLCRRRRAYLSADGCPCKKKKKNTLKKPDSVQVLHLGCCLQFQCGTGGGGLLQIKLDG